MKLLFRKSNLLLVNLALILSFNGLCQNTWQQEVEYRMDIDMDEENGRFDGKQWLSYVNNSPDTLKRVFYHLYFNAFQPGSMMDVRSQNLPDPDKRVRDRISRLSETEIGYHKISVLEHNKQPVNFKVDGTILEVNLSKPILPGQTTKFYMEFESQVPLQIRRSGKNNAEGIDFSMTQWYPKLAEYDEDGWHPNPYIAREFYGVWGDFQVNITINKNYLIGGTGELSNPKDIGYGYSKRPKKPRKKRATWRFKAENVHDFAWAADRDYKHETHQVKNGPLLHMIYDKTLENKNDWLRVAKTLDTVWAFIESNFGDYPYSQYTIIQGGDGGMEYPMATLITGKRAFKSLLGVSIHELMHSWYQGVLATDEAQYAYMDEGFTVYSSNLITKEIEDPKSDRNPQAGLYPGYFSLVESGNEEPLNTHADHFDNNFAYSVAAYVKGAIMLDQLRGIMGEAAQKRALLRYYNTWKFSHPDVDDFIRVMEKESGLVLDWYKDYWVNTTETIDYSVDTILMNDDVSSIVLSREGDMPMPIDLVVKMKDGSKQSFNIPLRVMRGNKPMIDGMKLLADWPWTNETYTLNLDGVKMEDIQEIIIDPKQSMADINRDNNHFPRLKSN